VKHDLLTVAQAAEVLAVTPRTVTGWCRTGRLPYVQLPSGRLRIRRSDLDALLKPSRTE
jgi:excisionase family DNA binding protein